LSSGHCDSRILPRSRHLPTIPFTRSRSENLNEIGVRLRIDFSCDRSKTPKRRMFGVCQAGLVINLKDESLGARCRCN
jgi:hypothetical protein